MDGHKIHKILSKIVIICNYTARSATGQIPRIMPSKKVKYRRYLPVDLDKKPEIQRSRWLAQASMAGALCWAPKEGFPTSQKWRCSGWVLPAKRPRYISLGPRAHLTHTLDLPHPGRSWTSSQCDLWPCYPSYPLKSNQKSNRTAVIQPPSIPSRGHTRVTA